MRNAAGAEHRPVARSQLAVQPALELYNTGKGMVIRLDSQSKPPPPDFNSA